MTHSPAAHRASRQDARRWIADGWAKVDDLVHCADRADFCVPVSAVSDCVCRG